MTHPPLDVVIDPSDSGFSFFLGDVRSGLAAGLALLFFLKPANFDTLCHFSKQLFCSCRGV